MRSFTNFSPCHWKQMWNNTQLQFSGLSAHMVAITSMIIASTCSAFSTRSIDYQLHFQQDPLAHMVAVTSMIIASTWSPKFFIRRSRNGSFPLALRKHFSILPFLKFLIIMTCSSCRSIKIQKLYSNQSERRGRR